MGYILECTVACCSQQIISSESYVQSLALIRTHHCVTRYFVGSNDGMCCHGTGQLLCGFDMEMILHGR